MPPSSDRCPIFVYRPGLSVPIPLQSGIKRTMDNRSSLVSEAPRRVDKPAHGLHGRAVPDMSQQSQVTANASMKSFPANTTTNWNVNVVLDRMLLELWQRRRSARPPARAPAAAPRGRAPARSRPPCAACPSPAAAAPAWPPAALHPRACHRQRKVRSTRQDPRWLSSVPVGLRASRASHPSCGEGLQPAPCERSDVRAVASNAAVAVVAATRLRVQPAAARWSQPLMVTLKRKRKQTCLSLLVAVVSDTGIQREVCVDYIGASIGNPGAESPESKVPATPEQPEEREK